MKLEDGDFHDVTNKEVFICLRLGEQITARVFMRDSKAILKLTGGMKLWDIWEYKIKFTDYYDSELEPLEDNEIK